MVEPAPSGRVTMAPAYEIPEIVVGGWQFSTGHHAGDPASAADRIALLMLCADRGLTVFDCADIYTGVEELYGAFLRQYRAERGREAADAIRLHTKYVPDLDTLRSIGKRDVEQIIDRSLRRLGVERLDLVQYYWWDWTIPGYIETGHWLRELCEAGKIRLLGATNLDVALLGEFAAAGVHFASNQVQYSLIDRRPERHLVEYCAQTGITLLCYGTLAGGLLTERYHRDQPPTPPHANRSLTKYMLMIDETGGWEAFQRLLDVLHEIAGAHRASIANVATRWVLDRPHVGAAIVGMTSRAHVDGASGALDLVLTADEHRVIDEALPRLPPGDVFGLERDRDGVHGRIMRYGLNRGG